MNPYNNTMTVSRLAIQVAKEYGLRVVTEENERPERDAQLALLREVITDLKTSDRFYSFRSIQNIHEIYKSVCTEPYVTDFIHNGATFVALTLGASQYNLAVEELADAYQIGFTTCLADKGTNLLDGNLLNMFKQNAWLVFCLLCRFAWYNEPVPGTTQQ